ncbi:MAG: restriction endonuclease [Ardenticatenaceae bacterium]|nr:restriction endonuclease [Ardenticatenaceae bacterium]MCB9442842.1 restriction endonuclease [Ardenticatenaceae bacterium]
MKAFVESLDSVISTNDGQWTVKGFIDVHKNIYTISSDTKIVSKVLEIHLMPQILGFAQRNGYAVVLPTHQNYYPDLSFVNLADARIKFAVDLKTTYRLPDYPDFCNGFTLGSHGEYFVNRGSTKNIQFSYKDYLEPILKLTAENAERAKIKQLFLRVLRDLCGFSDRFLGHFCLGIIYSRLSNSDDETKTYPIGELQSISSVISNFQFFVAEKWQIAGDKSGSGNTANIGSITKIGDILNSNGMFSRLGEAWFDDYWMNYGRISIKTTSGAAKKITSLTDFVVYRGGDASLIVPKAPRRKAKRGKVT